MHLVSYAGIVSHKQTDAEHVSNYVVLNVCNNEVAEEDATINWLSKCVVN